MSVQTVIPIPRTVVMAAAEIVVDGARVLNIDDGERVARTIERHTQHGYALTLLNQTVAELPVSSPVRTSVVAYLKGQGAE